MAPSNVLPIHGNEKTMNLNSLVLTNIQSSPYFKVHLYELKTYHQVIDEIYYKVNHLEPWEKGSRKTAGQTGMCGGVRGVGAGGIVSSAYCLLYKLYTLKLTRKQLIGLCTHADSPYIRALGLMYIRYTQPPGDLWEWYEPYLDDEEQIDVKAGGGNIMTIGEIAQQFLAKLDWYSTLFPRIPVPIQKQIEAHLAGYRAKNWNKAAVRHTDNEMAPQQQQQQQQASARGSDGGELSFGEAERVARQEGSRDRRPSPILPRRPAPYDRGDQDRSRDRVRSHDRDRSRDRDRRDRSRDHERPRDRERSRDQERARDHDKSRAQDDRHSVKESRRDPHRRSRSRSRSREHHHHTEGRHKNRSTDHRRSHDRSWHRDRRSKERKHSRSHDERNARRHDNGGRHSSGTVDEGSSRPWPSKRTSSSPNRRESSTNAFDRDLEKELQRVRAAKGSENGGCK